MASVVPAGVAVVDGVPVGLVDVPVGVEDGLLDGEDSVGLVAGETFAVPDVLVHVNAQRRKDARTAANRNPPLISAMRSLVQPEWGSARFAQKLAGSAYPEMTWIGIATGPVLHLAGPHGLASVSTTVTTPVQPLLLHAGS